MLIVLDRKLTALSLFITSVSSHYKPPATPITHMASISCGSWILITICIVHHIWTRVFLEALETADSREFLLSSKALDAILSFRLQGEWHAY
ncbi:hypothetical protein QBC45DRAFT_424485 [Copromyces sp. CBS 386.78]|nr:hypothetical protein QBC45DRAFT_424485 [Copromyces sp. CBS 386.78]